MGTQTRMTSLPSTSRSRSNSTSGDTLNRFGLLVTLEMFRSMLSADASETPSTAPSSRTPRSMLPPCRLANEQMVSNVSWPG